MPTEVKICGLSTPETMDAALDAGAEYVGLNFFPKSPRFVTLAQAAALAAQAKGRAITVALAVDGDDELLSAIARQVNPDMFQAHGSETPERIAAIKMLTGKPVMKVVKVGGPDDLRQAADFTNVADLFLFDTKAPKDLKEALPGGNGVAFDWSLLNDAKGEIRFMLAGGLNPTNVAEAIKITGAPIVDVSSGVESAPGRKDAGLIRKFIEAAKAAS
jgi:phosphoribosylanthranilate isomerase